MAPQLVRSARLDLQRAARLSGIVWLHRKPRDESFAELEQHVHRARGVECTDRQITPTGELVVHELAGPSSPQHRSDRDVKGVNGPFVQPDWTNGPFTLMAPSVVEAGALSAKRSELAPASRSSS
ncbi:hypothetical protein [Saccharopolyspora gloriosae]|uniref:hypothetical protein n=1 Tax=Saccharopolyspora gloriosae TaxID=455344 RepID=UPI001FB84DBE|nr:hypothetical protein [Saccharopolyspora gloriosae]